MSQRTDFSSLLSTCSIPPQPVLYSLPLWVTPWFTCLLSHKSGIFLMPLFPQTLVSSHQVLSIPSCKSLESTLLLHFHGLCFIEGSSLLSSVLLPEDVTNSIPQRTGTRVLFAQCKSDHIAGRQLTYAKTYPCPPLHCQPHKVQTP